MIYEYNLQAFGAASEKPEHKALYYYYDMNIIGYARSG